MTRADRIFVYFAVFEFGDDPAVVTQLMGIAPTKAWAKGDHVLGKAKTGRATHERWVLESRLAPAASIENQIDDLLPLLEEHGDAIREVGKRFRIAFRVAGYFYDFTQGWELSAEVIRRLAALNLLIDFDLYYLPDDDEPQPAEA